MQEICLMWLLSYVILFQLHPVIHRYHLTIPHEYIAVEIAFATLLIAGGFLLRQYKKYAGVAATLGLSRLAYLALFCTKLHDLLRPNLYTHIPQLITVQMQAIPVVLGMLVYWIGHFLNAGNNLPAYRGKRFLSDARKWSRGWRRAFVLGKGKDGILTIPDSARGKHVQIIGPTGSGKTQLILSLAYQDMLRGMPVFFMEAKGDQGDFEMFRRLAKLAGRAKDVVYFNPVHPESLTYNPIQPIRDMRDPIALANQLSRAIGREPGGTTDGEHYRSLDFARFVDLAELLLCTEEPFTLRDIYAYFGTENGRLLMFQKCKNKSLIGPADAGLKTNGGDLSSILAHLKPWVSGGLGNAINDPNPKITIEDIFEGKKLAYFAIPVGQMPLQTNALGRMLISNLLAYAQTRQLSKDRSPASIYLDEFPEFVTPAFSTLISTIRSAGIWACLSHQDLGQLKRIDGMDKEAFVANVLANTAGAKVFFKIISPEDAERVAAMMGTHKTKVRTRQIKTGLFGGGATGIGTEADKEVFRIHPNTLKTLVPFRAAAHLGDSNPAILSTPKIHEIERPA